MHVAIIGAGVGGLTLALELHARGQRCTVFEAAQAFRPLGVGVNLLPHATQVLARLGLEPALAAVAVQTRELCFYNRYGQFIYKEPRGRYAGYAHPQFSIHRADLHQVLLGAVNERVGAQCVRVGAKCIGFEQDSERAIVHFADAPAFSADVVVGCDGIHSAIRKQLFPQEGGPVYSGINMWRGTTVAPPFLTGASMALVGWFTSGKMVIYPIRDQVDDHGRQLVNWVAELARPQPEGWSWNRAARVEDVLPHFQHLRFDWLDIPALIAHADQILEYPMVDKDPLPRWSHGRVTLLGDAAHPMYPRGSNGAGQAILDARALADCLTHTPDPKAALQLYDEQRRPATSQVVLANRANPPDAILREVHLRTEDQPFERIDDVISQEELAALSDSYKRMAGFDRASLMGSGS